MLTPDRGWMGGGVAAGQGLPPPLSQLQLPRLRVGRVHQPLYCSYSSVSSQLQSIQATTPVYGGVTVLYLTNFPFYQNPPSSATDLKVFVSIEISNQ